MPQYADVVENVYSCELRHQNFKGHFMRINCTLLDAVSHVSSKTTNLGQANQNRLWMHEG